MTSWNWSRSAGSGLFGTAVHLGHQEDLLAVAVAQRLSHFDFALAVPVVVVPGIVHEIDAAVDGGTNNSRGQLVGRSLADVRTADADHGNGLTGFAERPVEHIAVARFTGARQCIRFRGSGGFRQGAGQGGFEEDAAIPYSLRVVLHIRLESNATASEVL